MRTYKYEVLYAKVDTGEDTYIQTCTAYVDYDEVIFKLQDSLAYLSVRVFNKATRCWELEHICHDLGTDEGRFQYSLVQKNDLPPALLDDFVNKCIQYCNTEEEYYKEFEHTWVEEKDED